jgi:hypothetical protein
MIIGSSLPFISEYISAVNESIKKLNPDKNLSRLQCCWLSFVILGLIVTNSLCWARYERFSIGKLKVGQISWMFRKAKIAWELLLQASTLHLIKAYNIKEGVLAIDDTDKERSKNTTQIAKVHKIKDKKTGGYFNGQNLVFLVLISRNITIPVGFCFYEPDPKQSAWRKEDERLRKNGVIKKHRPERPAVDPSYPGKKELGLKLLSTFKTLDTNVKIRAVVADAFYDTLDFMTQAAEITKQPQVISQIKKTQKIIINNTEHEVESFFKNYAGHTEEQILRCDTKKITYRSIKCKIKSHNKKYFLVALKYEDEADYRYLIASDMTWQDIDIIKTYAFRWLVEVCIQDWKMYEGWNQLAKQTGEDGSCRGAILSLLCDHALLLHNDQKVLFANKQPAATAGSLCEKVMMESLKGFIEQIVYSDDPKAMFDKYSSEISTLFAVNFSTKHMRNCEAELLESPEQNMKT